MQSLTIFQAASLSDTVSSISFSFSDPNFNIGRVACGISIAYGHDAYANSLDALGWVSCDGGELGIAYQLTSYDLELRRTAVDCEKWVTDLTPENREKEVADDSIVLVILLKGLSLSTRLSTQHHAPLPLTEFFA